MSHKKIKVVNCKKRKKKSLKIVTYVLFRELTEDYSLGNSLSDTYEKVLKNGKRGARIHFSSCWGKKKKKHVVKHQNIAN